MRMDRYEKMIPAYVLDALERAERAEVEEHLRTCDQCAKQLVEYQGVVGLLPYAAPPLVPPARLKARVLAATVGAPKPAFRFGDWFAGLLRSPAFAALALVIALVAVYQSWSLQNQLAQQAALFSRQREFLIAMAYADTPPIRVQGTDAAPRAAGRVYRNAEESTLAVFVVDMPTLAPNQVYQFWLIDPIGDRTSGGTFNVDSQGRGYLIARAPRALKEFTAVGVTIEPAGGSPKPTGTKVMGGSF